MSLKKILANVSFPVLSWFLLVKYCLISWMVVVGIKYYWKSMSIITCLILSLWSVGFSPKFSQFLMLTLFMTQPDVCRCYSQIFQLFFFAYFIILIFSGFDGSNSVHSYSTASLTIDIYAAVFTGFLQPFRLLQIYASGFFSLANCIVDMLS